MPVGDPATRGRSLVACCLWCACAGGEASAQSLRAPTWKDGVTTVIFAGAEINLSNRLQVRWVDERDADDGPIEVSVRRARSKVEGWVASKALSYEVEIDYASGVDLIDAYVDWDVYGTGVVRVRGGRFKVPFGRERLTSSGQRQLVDRSRVSAEFTGGREVGLQVWGRVLDRRIEYRLGAFDGDDGRDGEVADSTRLRQLDARVMVQPYGGVGFGEGDFDSRKTLRVAFAMNGEIDDGHGTTAGNDLRRRIVGVDVATKYRGASAVAEYFHGRFEPEAGSPFAARGLHLQAGWFLVPARVEMAARYGAVRPEVTGFGFREEREAAIGASYYLAEHRLKVQADVRRLDVGASGRASYQLRTQLQAVF